MSSYEHILDISPLCPSTFFVTYMMALGYTMYMKAKQLTLYKQRGKKPSTSDLALNY